MGHYPCECEGTVYARLTALESRLAFLEGACKGFRLRAARAESRLEKLEVESGVLKRLLGWKYYYQRVALAVFGRKSTETVHSGPGWEYKVEDFINDSERETFERVANEK